jgi:hypothetical protein
VYVLSDRPSLTMGDPPVAGKQPAKQLKPSRLRNEVNPESISEESATKYNAIQVPGSQTVIPETQLEHYADTVPGSDPLSPSDAALLERTALPRKGKEPMSVSDFPLDFKYLSKDNLLSQSTSAIPPVAFSFGQARQMTAKVLLTAEGTASKTATYAARDPGPGVAQITIEQPKDGDFIQPSSMPD